MNIYNRPGDIIADVEFLGKRVQAGIWQGNEEFKDQEMRVLRNIVLTVECETKEILRDYSGADQPWSELHFLERINGIPANPGTSYKIWPYSTFQDEGDPYLKGKKFSHTYMERFWPKKAGQINMGYPNNILNKGIRFPLGDLNDVIENLRNNPLTRQAYLPIWFPEDTWAINNKERVPCTLGYYFWVEDEHLFMNYTIRSCDAFRHFRNDIYLTGRLLLYVAKQLNLKIGELTMIIYNIHLFKNDLYALHKKESKLL